MEPNSPSKIKFSIVGFIQSHRILYSCAIILVILLLLAGACHLLYRRGNVSQLLGSSSFVVVVDCGSTGTRVNVYDWIVESDGGLPLLLHTYPDNSIKSLLWRHGCRYHCMQTEPGLDKYVDNSSGVRASLEPLIHWAERVVPSDRHRDTPIFVLAMAGLRKLPREYSGLVLKDVENVVKEHSFMSRKSWIRVLSGKEEAYYGWVALNYKMGRLQTYSGLPTLGLLDLGGSSLQVVMEIHKSRDDKHLFRSKIGTIQRNLIAYSLPEFGLNEAFDRTVAILSQGPTRETFDAKSKVRHPCLSSSFLENYSCYNCFRGNNTNLRSIDSGAQKNISTSINLVGELQIEECRRLSKAVATNSNTSYWSNSTVYPTCKAGLPSTAGANFLSMNISNT